MLPPSTFLSIDPGKKHIAVAEWSLAHLRRAYLWTCPPARPLAPRVCRWADIGRAFRANHPILPIVVEIPQIYRQSKGDPNDLLDLAGIVGAISTAPDAILWSPLPREWKGQIPKQVTKQRVDAKLTPTEIQGIEWPIRSLAHNVYDAIHLGLVYLQKHGFRSEGYRKIKSP